MHAKDVQQALAIGWKSKLVSFGIIDRMAHKSQNNLSVKQACLIVPHVSRCPSLPYTHNII